MNSGYKEDYTVIYDKLKRLEENQLIDYNYLHDLISLTTRLIEVVSRGNPNIMREVSVMGGGKVLEMESEKIHNDGIAQGIAQSIIKFLKKFGAIPNNVYERIASETNIDVLNRWLDITITVSSIEEFEKQM